MPDMDNIDLITRNMEEIVTREELNSLDISHSRSYIGFEPSGVPHIGTAVLWPMKLIEAASTGMSVTVLLADWHALINDKLGGDMEMIRRSGQMLEQSMKAMGLVDNVKFVWAADLVDDSDYWMQFIHVAKHSNLARLKRALPIMGRTEDDADQDFSKYLYPLMQVNDIFYSDFDVAFGGMDQRHAHMLARDIAEKMHRKKVISIHGPLLGSLAGNGRMGPFAKMSKSSPDSAIFVSDTREAIVSKLKHAYCPTGEINGNPVTDILRHIIFPYYRGEVIIERAEKFGGNLSLGSFEEFSALYTQGKIHPMDLKAAVARYVDIMISPARAVYNADAVREMFDAVNGKK
jgi:tyrosyl-tRNA synthetase